MTLFGERIIEVDEKEVARAQKLVRDYHAELTRLNTEAARRPPVKPINIDPKEVEKQKKGLKDLREGLAGRQLELRVKGMTELGGQIEQLGNQFDALAIKLKTAFNFDLSNSDLQKGLAELRAQQAREQTALVKASLDEQKEVRLGHERDVRSAEAALSADALARRRAELDAQLEDVRSRYAPQIAELLRNAQNKNLSSSDRRQFQAEAGQLQVLQNRQIVALERQRDQELEQIAQDRLDKVRAAQQETLSSHVRVSEAVIKVLEGQRDRELAMAGDVPQARLAIEQRYAPSSCSCGSSSWPWKRRCSAAPCAPRTCSRCGTRPVPGTSGRRWNARPGPSSSMGCACSN
ncbi:hypothetical protein [Deinococcus multiflagellatus]|uniref:Uncharacterized protein n=1 Tax=Deinococcus multiflagellatus TaxID=1656887 RepID=A0ABW1ZRZ9_9DEIO